jgi:hypothetical protein
MSSPTRGLGLDLEGRQQDEQPPEGQSEHGQTGSDLKTSHCRYTSVSFCLPDRVLASEKVQRENDVLIYVSFA